MTKMEIKVNGCNECPMKQWYEENFETFCNITNTKLLENNSNTGDERLNTPDDCPLKKEPVTITLQ